MSEGRRVMALGEKGEGIKQKKKERKKEKLSDTDNSATTITRWKGGGGR